MMRCSKARDYLSRDLDGMLPPDVTAGLREHVDGCRECQAFREDLVLGRRLLAATEPRLPDNFDWKLQLRLNQALQQRAGETAYPWLEEREERRSGWLPAFGAAASVGLAAVLAVAVFMGPQRPGSAGLAGGAPGRSAASVVAATPLGLSEAPDATQPAAPAGGTAASLAGRSDRRPLFGGTRSGGLYGNSVQRSVATGAGAPSATFDRGWSGTSLEDLRTIQQLRADNEQLRRMLTRQQQELQRLKAQLDTTGGQSLDTGTAR